MKKTIINIYTFIRMSNEEPSRFIQDDFDTVEKEILCIKQFGLPGTYALKYDALMDSRYQELLRKYLDDHDELSAWWEITEPLCIRAGVPFRGREWQEKYSDPVDSAYCIGYTPEERKKLVDAYMVDFHEIWRKYPETIGSWILDPVTVQYAADRYGVAGCAICRDQIATDGFTLWGGYPNGIYYPSRKNEFIPAQTEENQISVPMFRLLGPDPIYNFEAEARDHLPGVFTLEPAWLTGRDPDWISWIFKRLTDEDTLGISYAQISQENNFLWENIESGLKPQLSILTDLCQTRSVRIETMASSARWFQKQYRITPPLTYQASEDWDKERNLSAMWYASSNYRLGFLGESGHLRIRDFFLFNENYASRYLAEPIHTSASHFDSLPVLSPQLWKIPPESRPFIRLVDEAGNEPAGAFSYHAENEGEASACLTGESGKLLARFSMDPDCLTVQSIFHLQFDYLPEFRIDGKQIILTHNHFEYFWTVAEGTVRTLSEHTLKIIPNGDRITLKLSEVSGKNFRNSVCVPDPPKISGVCRAVPPAAPAAEPADSVFPWDFVQQVSLHSRIPGEIRYTTDGTDPKKDSPLYQVPLKIRKDTVVQARLFASDGSVSSISRFEYRFGLKNLSLTSPTVFDPRKFFLGNGISDLLQEPRGNSDYLCGRWRGTLDSLDLTAELNQPRRIRSVSLGFLSHHRSGIVFPESIELFTGSDKEHLHFKQEIQLPCKPPDREIVRSDFTLPVNETIGVFRIIARRYKALPYWSQYHGDKNVFTLSDCLIVVPEQELSV